jgi:hypothetical protein
MAGIPESVRALVAEGHLAHLVTVKGDCSPLGEHRLDWR